MSIPSSHVLATKCNITVGVSCVSGVSGVVVGGRMFIVGSVYRGHSVCVTTQVPALDWGTLF